MQGSNMGGMNIQNLRKNAGLALDPVKETSADTNELSLLKRNAGI